MTRDERLVAVCAGTKRVKVTDTDIVEAVGASAVEATSTGTVENISTDVVETSLGVVCGAMDGGIGGPAVKVVAPDTMHPKLVFDTQAVMYGIGLSS